MYNHISHFLIFLVILQDIHSFKNILINPGPAISNLSITLLGSRLSDYLLQLFSRISPYNLRVHHSKVCLEVSKFLICSHRYFNFFNSLSGYSFFYCSFKYSLAISLSITCTFSTSSFYFYKIKKGHD